MNQQAYINSPHSNCQILFVKAELVFFWKFKSTIIIGHAEITLKKLKVGDIGLTSMIIPFSMKREYIIIGEELKEKIGVP